MKKIHMWVSDEMHSWLEKMLGHDLVLDGMGFQIGDVDLTDGGIHCKAIFQAAQQREGGPALIRTIQRQDEGFRCEPED